MWQNTAIEENSLVFSQVLDEDLALKFGSVELKRATTPILVRLVITDLAPHFLCLLIDVICIEKHQSLG